MYGTPGALNQTPSGATAKTLILIGLILQLIFALIFLFVEGVAAILVSSLGGVFAFFAVIWIVFGLIDFVFLYLIWTLVYKRVQQAQYEQAKSSTLIFAILSLIFGGVIPGVLYIIAYIKLGDAVREQQAPPQGYGGVPPGAPGVPYGGQPTQPAYPQAPYQQPPAAPAAAPAAPAPVICPKCGKPATFVPQYNRYYCYTDQQYV